MFNENTTRELVEIYTRRLQLYRQQAASLGVLTPPYITMEMEKLETEIRNLDPSAPILQQKEAIPVAHPSLPPPEPDKLEMAVEYADLEIRIYKREAQGYPVELSSTGLTSDQYIRTGHLTGYLNPDILAWQPGQADDGQKLFDMLFADPQLRTGWTEIRGSYERRRIRLRIDLGAPELHPLLWELLQDTTTDRTGPVLSADAKTPFSRYLDLRGVWFLSKSIIERPIKLLVAIANPDDLDEWGLSQVDLDDERQIIEQSISDFPGQLSITFLEPPFSIARLERALKKGYHFLHIVAHGAFNRESGRGHLLLADKRNEVALASDRDFAAMLDRLDRTQTPRLIFLASCQSATRDTTNALNGLAPRIMEAGFPAVIAMQDFISMKTAKEFTGTFYHQLLQHGQIDLACNEARSALLSTGTQGSHIPILFSCLPKNQLLNPSV